MSMDVQSAGSGSRAGSGLSMFFPAYNDSGTIASLVITALRTARTLTPDYEVIVVNDGSADETADILDELARIYPEVRVVHHEKNRGYGGALRTGFATRHAGTGLLHRRRRAVRSAEMELLWRRFGDDVDLVNGYKISRSDPLHRIVIGRIYHHTVKLLFGLKVRDVDCDFRLMRRSIFDTVHLEKNSGVICLEMMKKITGRRLPHRRGAGPPLPPRLRQVAVLQLPRLFRTAIDVMKLWFALVIRREHLVNADRRRRPSPWRHLQGPSVTDAYREFYRGRRVLVTGGLGFIGSNLARQLVDLGADVLLVDSMIPRLRRQPLQHRRHRGPRARQHRATCANETSWTSWFATARSSSTSRGRSATSTACAIRSPTSTSTAARSSRCSRPAASSIPSVKVVFAGTRQVYGKPDRLPVDESHLVRPIDVNGVNKAAGEYYHLLYNNVVRRARVLAAADERLRPASADPAQPPGLHRLVHPAGDRGRRDPGLRRRLADARLRLRGRRRGRVPAGGACATPATARSSTSAAASRSSHRDLVELLHRRGRHRAASATSRGRRRRSASTSAASIPTRRSSSARPDGCRASTCAKASPRTIDFYREHLPHYVEAA